MLKKIQEIYFKRSPSMLLSAVDFQMKFLLGYAAVVHLGLSVLSVIFSLPVMFVYYLATLILFIVFASFIDSRRFIVIYCLTYVEILLHIHLCHLIIGLPIGIELYYIMLIPTGSYILLMPYSRLFQRIFVFLSLIINAASYIRIQVIHPGNSCVMKVPNFTHTVFSIYSISMVFCMAALQSYFFVRSIVARFTDIREENAVLNLKANHDALTGLLNRHEMNIRLEQAFLLYQRQNIPCSVCIGDIDKFKSINDTYGHNAGDYVLKTLAQLMQQNTRKGDFLGRWGGEEFVLLMQADKTVCYTRAEHLRSLVENHIFEYNGIIIPVTITFGVAGADITMPDTSALIDAADKVLYEGKKNGRKRTILK